MALNLVHTVQFDFSGFDSLMLIQFMMHLVETRKLVCLVLEDATAICSYNLASAS